jgi:ElaB/YqjD/DUF883 family membrane-anchored ribosome-binding protein
MFNTANYFEKTRDIDWASMPEALSKGHTLVTGAADNDWEGYKSNDTVRRVVEAYFTKLRDYLATQKPAAAMTTPAKTLPAAAKKTAPAKKAKPAAKAKTAKPATGKKAAAKPKVKAKPQYNTTPVERIDSEVAFIRRYAAMNGKVKTQAQVLTLLHGLQKAILERRITKDSPYAKEIKLMQSQLIGLYEKMGDAAEIQIEPKNLKRYQEIAYSQSNMTSVLLLKAYIALNGKKQVKEKAERLISRMRKLVQSGKITKEDRYVEQLNQAFVNLNEYVKNNPSMLTISRSELNGIKTLLGSSAAYQKKKATRRLPLIAV